MKKLFLLSTFTTILFLSCSSDSDIEQQKVDITLKFTHNWDGTPVTSSDFNIFKFNNENGETISLVSLRYLLSNITFTNGSDVFTFKKYNLINIGEEKGLTINLPEKISKGSYQLKFTFGFSDTDNQDGTYQDLNTLNFGVPGMLGGGYHYMQFDGKYKDANNQDANFNYHAIRAVDRSDPNNLKFLDTSFNVDLGTLVITNNAEITIKANISEWFKNPNTWDLNVLNTVLMPNFEAQKLMSANGKTVFSLGSVTQ